MLQVSPRETVIQEISLSFGVPTSRKKRETWGTPLTSGARLLADAEPGDDAFIALGIVFLEVVEQATALADQHEKSAA